MLWVNQNQRKKVNRMLRECNKSRIYLLQAIWSNSEKVPVGNDQEKAQSEKDSHSKNRGGKNYICNQVVTP